MKVAIGSDHAGYRLKQELKAWLQAEGYEVVDHGTESEDSVDYPDYALAVARSVAKREVERGLLICGTGIGMSIVANKVRGARAALVSEMLSARLSREHNDANIVCLGARIIGPDQARECLRTFLTTDYQGGRHQRRLDKITAEEERPFGARS